MKRSISIRMVRAGSAFFILAGLFVFFDPGELALAVCDFDTDDCKDTKICKTTSGWDCDEIQSGLKCVPAGTGSEQLLLQTNCGTKLYWGTFFCDSPSIHACGGPTGWWC